MNYKIYKLEFINGVHFGRHSLEDSQYVVCADTLFSALCHEAVKRGPDVLEKFVACGKSGYFRISDAMPYVKDTLFLPKPILPLEIAGTSPDLDLKWKKKYKSMKYIAVEDLEDYLAGSLKPEQLKKIDGLGVHDTRTQAAVRGNEDTLPYRVGTYHFHEGNGLYFIAAYDTTEAMELLEELLTGLGFSGIGGKRSNGLGRFKWHMGVENTPMMERLKGDGGVQMLLSVAMPGDEELEQAMEGASFLLMKRSGFVESTTYAQEFQRKKDFYVFSAGSCFNVTFSGKIEDVSAGGKHPVYRYAKPLFFKIK